MASKPEVYVRGYRGQAVYIIRRIEEVIDQVLARSKVPPILILQSDHGSGLRLNMQSKERTDLRERMGILNAYCFPNRDHRGPYQDITPVNSFRVVFNTSFGARFEVLSDRSNYSTWSEPYQFLDVTAAVRSPSRQGRGPGNRVPGIQHRHDVAESSMARGRRSPRVSGPKTLLVATIGSVARSVAVSPS
jgi:hypothetical protein